MWEGEPVRVDPKRPLVGFALVAVLCVVLMGLSVGRGYSADLFHQGRPISPSATADRHVDRAPAPARAAAPDAGPVAPPAQSARGVLAPEAIGVESGSGSVTSVVSRSSVVAEAEDDHESADEDADETTVEDDAADEAAQDDTSAHHADKAQHKADKSAAKADRKSHHAAAKAERKADRAADKADRAADKAADKADRAAAKAERKAAHAAAEATRRG